MKLPSPKLPFYDVGRWQRLPFPERMRLVCQSWAVDGYGTPALVYLAYALKVALYVTGWLAFCSTSAVLGPPSTFGSWWSSGEALAKAVLFSMAFEVLGLGCGSGPLTGRYLPPIGGVLYFARPGTLKRPLFPALPLLGGRERTWVDVALYVAHLALLLRALLAPSVEAAQLVPVLAVLAVLSVADTTIFLASRAEHYATALVCFLFPADALAGAKLVWLGVWWWAATSKLNRHFPAVVCVMVSNSAVIRWPALRKRMYVDFPNDLRPSKLAIFMAHAGTFTEYAFPLLLVTSHGGIETAVGLAIMLGFHVFITSHVPMGVPIEWNVLMVYGAFVLFGAHADVRVTDVGSMTLLALLFVPLVLVPVAGNLAPKSVSFLPSMRYYAGNWAYGVWLFRGESVEKLDRLVRGAPRVDAQLRALYDETTTVATLSKVMAFRAMHLHGRALRELVPKAVDDVDDYTWLDGELVAGVALGWNFGDGHLHDESLLAAIQERCAFEPGELRCIFVESQPMFGRSMAWRIADAATGEIARGEIAVAPLADVQPWPDAAPPSGMEIHP